jgi:hypothetical protein
VLRAERRLFGRSSRGQGTSWLAVTRVPSDSRTTPNEPRR